MHLLFLATVVVDIFNIKHHGTSTKWPHFTEHFRMHFLKKICILNKISVNFVPEGPVENELKHWPGSDNAHATAQTHDKVH